jgi:hypothetical protein
MSLTPYPSLATLPEVVVNGGKFPAHAIDVFAARTVYASSIPGVVLDCNLFTGKNASGGTPTDNASAINAVLATATANNPVHLVIDGGSAIGHAIKIPPTGHVTISGHGWSTGFFILPGSNCHGITNTAGTDLASNATWNPGIGPTSQLGQNVTLRDFRLHCNRGTFPTGNCNGGKDGTFPAGSGTPDARGSYAQWLLTGIFLNALDNVEIDRLWIYDAPTFHASLYACTKVWAHHCRVEAATPSFSGNTDGFHFNGGCQSCLVSWCWISTGDDAVGFNLDEGNGQDGADLVMADCVTVGCQSVLRVYGKDNAACRRVEMRNVKSTGVRVTGITLGDPSGSASTLAEATHSLSVTDCDFSGGANAVMTVSGNAGHVEFTRVRMLEPLQGVPMVLMTSSTSTISTLVFRDCAIYRNTFGHAPAYLLDGSYGTIGDLVVDNFHYAEESGQAFTDVSELIILTGTTVGSISFSGRLKGVGTAIVAGSSSTVGSIDVPDLTHQSNTSPPSFFSIVTGGATVPVSVGRFRGVGLAGMAGGTVSLSGPGVLASGFPVADALMGNNTLYLASDHSNALSILIGGVHKTVGLS